MSEAPEETTAEETVAEATPVAEEVQASPETPAPAAAESEASPDETPNGDDAIDIESILCVFQQKLMGDPRINYLFYGVSSLEHTAQHRSLVAAAVCSDSANDWGDTGYARLARLGMNDRQFNVLLEILDAVMREHEVTESRVAMALDNARTIRSQALGR